MSSVQHTDILNTVAELQIRSGNQGISGEQILFKLLPPPAEKGLRQQLRQQVVFLVPLSLSESSSQPKRYALTPRGWLETNSAGRVLEVIEAFLQAFRHHIQRGSLGPLSWNDLVDAGLSRSDFHLACIIANCFELCAGGTFNVLGEGVSPSATFDLPADISELLDMTSPIAFANYRQAESYPRRVAKKSIQEEATGDARRAVEIIYKHLVHHNSWPLTRSLNAKLITQGLDLASLSGRFIRGQDVHTVGAKTSLTLAGLLIVESAEEERRDILTLLRRIGKYVQHHPEARSVKASVIADGVELDEYTLMSCLSFLQNERWLYVSTSDPPSISDTQFNLAPHLASHAKAENYLDLIINDEEDLRRAEFSILKSWNETLKSGMDVDYQTVSSPNPHEREPALANNTAELLSVDYKIDKRLGEGTVGEVWKAEDQRLLRSVALKFVRDSPTRAIVLEHARALSRVAHPSIVTVYDVVRIQHPASGSICDAIVMELVVGETLTSKIGQNISLIEIKSIGLVILDALDAYHSAGLAHLDMHEDNVIVTTGSAKVIDPIYHDTAAFSSTSTRTQQQKRDVRQAKDILLQLLAGASTQAADQFQRSTPLNPSLSYLREKFLEALASP